MRLPPASLCSMYLLQNLDAGFPNISYAILFSEQWEECMIHGQWVVGQNPNVNSGGQKGGILGFNIKWKFGLWTRKNISNKMVNLPSPASTSFSQLVSTYQAAAANIFHHRAATLLYLLIAIGHTCILTRYTAEWPGNTDQCNEQNHSRLHVTSS